MIERVLSALFPHEDIAKDGSLYLRRWRVLGYNARLPSFFGRNVMIHRIVRPDDDRDPHDHPWDFWSLVLAGGYVEEIWVQLADPFHALRGLHPRGLFALDWNPAEHTHRIVSLPRGEAWTFVVASERKRRWGFWCPAAGGRWLPHEEYFAADPSQTKEESP